MPIRRRGDEQVLEEATRPQRRDRRSRSSRDATESPTVPVIVRGPRDQETLFSPTDAQGGSQGRLETPTVRLRKARLSGDAPTRIVRHRAKDSQGQAKAKEDDPMLDPPVGWLVVVRGPGKGRVVALGNGMNVIGRGRPGRVKIDFGDDSIARTNHARVIYEPRERRYLLSHGDGSNLTYLNHEVVMAPVEIESGSMIEIGETTLRFQAFCSKDFDWTDVDD